MYKLALLFAILASAQAQLTSNGTCDFSKIIPDDATTENFTRVDQLFEIERISNNWITGHCTSLNWTDISENSLSVTVNEVLNKKLIVRNGTITSVQIELQHPYTFNVVFSDFNSNFTFLGAGDNYVILYACSNVGTQKAEYAWVLGVNTTVTEAESNTITTIIKNNSLENATWVQTSHTAESCKSGGISNIQLSPVFVLILGFLISKGL